MHVALPVPLPLKHQPRAECQSAREKQLQIDKKNEEINVNYIGNQLRIALNTKFLLEYIQNLPKESTVTLEFVKSNGSVKIKKEDDDNYIYILMPLALRD